MESLDPKIVDILNAAKELDNSIHTLPWCKGDTTGYTSVPNQVWRMWIHGPVKDFNDALNAIKPAIDVKTDETIPAGEVHLKQGGEILGKIVNIATDDPPKKRRPSLGDQMMLMTPPEGWTSVHVKERAKERRLAMSKTLEELLRSNFRVLYYVEKRISSSWFLRWLLKDQLIMIRVQLNILGLAGANGE